MDSQEVQISHESSDDMLRVEVVGPVDMKTLTMYTTRYQEAWTEHSLVLWNLSAADPSAITSDDILNLDHAFEEIIKLRGGGKTAVVVSDHLELIANIAIGMVEHHNTHEKVAAFLDEDEALAWLQS